MKNCKTCKKLLSVENFYSHKAMKDGRLNICKDCTCKRVKKHRVENIEAIQSYDRKRGKTKQRRDAVKKYQEENRAMFNEIKRAWRLVNKHKVKAQYKARMAWLKGLINKKPCEVCGETEVEGHHPNYDEPLNVIWLCTKHHAELHAEIRQKQREQKNE
jgi:hypothetical protein